MRSRMRGNLWGPHTYTMCVCLVAQSCPTLCDPMDCSLPGSSVHGDSSGKNTGVSCHALLQGIFPTQGLNPGLPHCKEIIYPSVHGESPGKNIGVGCHAFLQGIFPTLQGLPHCKQIIYQLSYQGSPYLLSCKPEIQPVHSKGDQPWVFFGRNDAKAETPVLWPSHAKS